MIHATNRRPRRAAALATALLALSLSACATSGPVAQDGVDLPPGTSLFAAPPSLADCDRIDVAGLQAFSTARLPQPRPIVTFADPAKRDRTWAGCVGQAETQASDGGSGGAADPAAGSGQKATTADDAGAPSPGKDAPPEPTQEGTIGPVAWLVRYATSGPATRARPFANPIPDGGANRTLVRSSYLGDAPARVELSVHADDHTTLVMVTVFDPGTGRNAAECGVGEVPGSAVDDVVTWCLRTMAGQLVRKA